MGVITASAAKNPIWRLLAFWIPIYLSEDYSGTIDTSFLTQIKSTKPEVFASWKGNMMFGRF